MGWISLAVWLLSFLLSKSSGASTGRAALTATGAGLATWYLADPANTDNVLGISYGDDKAVPGDPNVTSGSSASTSGLASIGKTLVSEASSTLKSWGPTGTLGVIAGTKAINSSASRNYLPWIAGGLALFLLTR